MSSDEVIGRFAPTPSGFMHVGNILCAMTAYLSAKSKGGKFLIRIEDVDVMRCPRRAASDIIDTLAAFGMVSDEPIVYQSERTDIYRRAQHILGNVASVYPCFCTRADLHAGDVPRLADGGVLYGGTCKRLTVEQVAEKEKALRPAYRISVPDETVSFIDGICGEYIQNLARECGDFIIRRSDGVYAYQLAVVADDAEQGVTEVVRGADLLYDTPRQIYLQRLLGLPTPEYYHIPLVVGADRRKLSKSAGDSAALLLKTKSATEIIGELAFAAGIIDENRPTTLAELVPMFSVERIKNAELRMK